MFCFRLVFDRNHRSLTVGWNKAIPVVRPYFSKLAKMIAFGDSSTSFIWKANVQDAVRRIESKMGKIPYDFGSSGALFLWVFTELARAYCQTIMVKSDDIAEQVDDFLRCSVWWCVLFAALPLLTNLTRDSIFFFCAKFQFRTECGFGFVLVISCSQYLKNNPIEVDDPNLRPSKKRRMTQKSLQTRVLTMDDPLMDKILNEQEQPYWSTNAERIRAEKEFNTAGTARSL